MVGRYFMIFCLTMRALLQFFWILSLHAAAFIILLFKHFDNAIKYCRGG